MITTKITVEPHLAQYCYAKYLPIRKAACPSALRTIWMYTIWVYNLLEKRPVNCPPG